MADENNYAFIDATLHAVDLQDRYDAAVLLTSDGDFASLVRYLRVRYLRDRDAGGLAGPGYRR